MNSFLIRRIRGPVFLLTFALTAILSQWCGFSFARSWPLYLLAGGLLRLGEAALPWSSVPPVYGVTRPVQRASLTGALVELVFGVVFLLLTLGTIPLASFWAVFGRWWPLLLVLLGAFLLVERLLDRGLEGRYPGRSIAARPRRNGGLVFLVLLLAALGLSSQGWRSSSFPAPGWDPHGNWGWNWDWGGETYENVVTLSEPIAADSTLAIDNARGDVEIAPSEDGRIHVDAHQTTHGSERDKNRAFAAARPSLEVRGGAATLSVPGRNGVEVRLVVRVPDTVECTVRTRHGDVAASGLQRPLTVDEDHGDIALDSLGGPVRLQMDHGSVRAHTLAADLTIGGRVNDVTLSGVRGKSTLDGEFFGNTSVEGAGGPVLFHSNRTTIELPRLAGSLSLDGENLRVDGAPGGLRIETRSKEIQVTGLSGPATIRDSNSDVSVVLAEPLGAVSLQDDTGNISLTLPGDANCSVRGTTGEDNGIESDFPLAETASGGSKTVAGQIGKGGPLVSLEARHGDLSLHRESAGAGKRERRLRSDGEPPSPVVQ